MSLGTHHKSTVLFYLGAILSVVHPKRAMTEADNTWVPLEHFYSSIGKKIKSEYIKEFGEDPPRLPQPIKGTTQVMYPYYYQKPWLKAHLDLN